MNNLKKIKVAVLALLFSTTIYAQSPGLLKAQGKIPKEFITDSTIKYKKQVKGIEGKKDKKSKKEFLLKSNFSIDDILQSGLVLFNDPATNYVNEVLKQLPFSNKKLTRKKPRVYVLNTSAVNAFATEQGVIFITIGLLAKLENEAQLAFVLSHELMHIQHRHGIDKFINAKKIGKEIKRKNKTPNGISLNQALFKKSMYSQKLEMEADEDGLELFLKSEYEPESVLKIFKILYYSDLPFSNLEFEKSFFQDDKYIFPSNLWLDTVQAIRPMVNSSNLGEDKESVNASHPSSQERLAKMKERIRGLELGNKKSFLISEKRFIEIQEKARYQLPFLNLYSENFPEAIYTSFLLLKKYPDDVELKKVIGKCLYITAKYKNASWEYDFDFTEVEGASQQLYHLISKMDDKELTILALKYNLNLFQKNKEDKELDQITKDLFIEFANHFDSLDEFGYSMNESFSQADSTNEVNNKVKYLYWQNAFVQEITIPSFQSMYEQGIQEKEKREEEISYYESEKGKKAFRKRRKKEKKKGKSLGIKKIVVVNPFYLSLDARKNNVTQYVRGEKKQNFFSDNLRKYGKKSKVETVILDINDLSSNMIEEFNDIVDVNQYFLQQMNQFDLTLTPGYQQNKIDIIADKYETPYFLWTGVVSLRQKNHKWKGVLASVVVPYITPFLIPGAVKPDYDMLYYAILFDVKTGRRSIIKMNYFDHRDSKSILNAHLYDVFHQIEKE